MLLYRFHAIGTDTRTPRIIDIGVFDIAPKQVRYDPRPAVFLGSSATPEVHAPIGRYRHVVLRVVHPGQGAASAA